MSSLYRSKKGQDSANTLRRGKKYSEILSEINRGKKRPARDMVGKKSEAIARTRN